MSINTSIRAGEIWGLRFDDVQQDGQVILIRRQFDRIKKDFRPTKGKKERLVPCNAELLKEILALKNEEPSTRTTVFFEKETGAPICHDNFKKRKFDRDVEEWGGKGIRFHDMRHTGTTLMIGEGLDLKTVQEICGHKDLKTTLKLYASTR